MQENSCKRICYDIFVRTKFMHICFPKDLTVCFKIAATYITVYSTITTALTMEAASAEKTTQDVNDVYKQVEVKSISSYVLWSCREYSTTRQYYKTFFYFLLVALILAFVLTTKPPVSWSGFWQSFIKLLRIITCCVTLKTLFKKRPWQSCKKWIEFVTSVIVKTSFFILLTTYDISIWECLEGPSEIIYNTETSEVKLNNKKSAIAYQRGGSIASLVLLCVGMVMSIVITFCRAKYETVGEYQADTEYTDEEENKYKSLKMMKIKEVTMFEIAKRLKPESVKLSALENS